MSMRRLVTAWFAVAVCACPVVLPKAAAVGTSGNANAHPDFNNDGYADLIIPVPGLTVGVSTDAGGFWLVPGSSKGPVLSLARLITQNTMGVPGFSQHSGQFAQDIATGDFNGDGYDDAAVCAPLATVGGFTAAGQAIIFYGTTSGLRFTAVGTINRNSPGVPGTAAFGELFCRGGLVAADFNGDGRSDLMIGAQAERVSGLTNAGAIFIVPGSSFGITGIGTRYIDQNTPGVVGVPELNGLFGYFGAGAGDLNGDGDADLLVSAEYATVNGQPNAGGFYEFFGSPGGLHTLGSRFITQQTPGVPGAALASHYFAEGNPAIADFNDDGYDDALIPAPYETVGGIPQAGSFFVFHGSSHGLALSGVRVIDKNSPGVVGLPTATSYFSDYSLAPGDFNGDGNVDAVVADSYAVVNGHPNAGGFHEFFGRSSALSTIGARFFSQQTPGVPGSPSSSTGFSLLPLRAGDFNGDGFDDACVPAAFEDIGGLSNSGAVYIFFGGVTGLKAAGVRQITASGLPGGSDQTNARFGFFGP